MNNHGGKRLHHCPRKMTHDQAREALEMYKQNIPEKVLERKFNCDRRTIRRAIERLGVEVPRRKHPGPQPTLNAEQIDAIKALVNRGIAKTVAARMYHISTSTILRSLRRMQ